MTNKLYKNHENLTEFDRISVFFSIVATMWLPKALAAAVTFWTEQAKTRWKQF